MSVPNVGSDLLDDLLSSNPNEPANKGIVLLLRTEIRSDFKSLRTEMNQRFEQVDPDSSRLTIGSSRLTRASARSNNVCSF